eukprot:Sdes_comp20022_c0_seq1m12745
MPINPQIQKIPSRPPQLEGGNPPTAGIRAGQKGGLDRVNRGQRLEQIAQHFGRQLDGMPGRQVQSLPQQTHQLSAILQDRRPAILHHLHQHVQKPQQMRILLVHTSLLLATGRLHQLPVNVGDKQGEPNFGIHLNSSPTQLGHRFHTVVNLIAANQREQIMHRNLVERKREGGEQGGRKHDNHRGEQIRGGLVPLQRGRTNLQNVKYLANQLNHPVLKIHRQRHHLPLRLRHIRIQIHAGHKILQTQAVQQVKVKLESSTRLVAVVHINPGQRQPQQATQVAQPLGKVRIPQQRAHNFRQASDRSRRAMRVCEGFEGRIHLLQHIVQDEGGLKIRQVLERIGGAVRNHTRL